LRCVDASATARCRFARCCGVGRADSRRQKVRYGPRAPARVFVSRKPLTALDLGPDSHECFGRVDVDEREGYFRWSIVSGGITPGSDRPECEIIADAMMARGIPAEIILREDRAVNTGENVILSLPVIDAALGLANIRRVICLGNSWTARRYPMTLHRHWPEVEKMLVMVDGFATPRALWHTDPEFSRRMLTEWDKIEPYKAKGFIAEWPVR